MTQPANSYMLALRPDNENGVSLVWRTKENGKDVAYCMEPARSNWQRVEANVLSLLPLDREL